MWLSPCGGCSSVNVFAAVGRLVYAVNLRRVGDLRVGRIHEDGHVVEGALPQLHFGVHPFPRRAGII